VPWDAERLGWAEGLAEELPNATLVLDRQRSAFETFLRALEEQDVGGAWHFEDDATLTGRWREKATWEVKQHGESIIQGFSRLKADAERGSRWMRGSTFLYCICFWLPSGQAEPLHDHLVKWWDERDRNDEAFDFAMQTQIKRYWLVVPSLVQHREAKSMIGGPGRHPRRQSRTFVA
jgi:hypothetical protein